MKTPTPALLGALACLALGFVRLAASDKPEMDLVHSVWPSQWITCPGALARGPGVYHFRKHITLAQAPTRFVLHVSGDNRFTFFVNGVRVGDGPARGDLDHWRYETFDVAALLKAGDNTLAATVWNYGGVAPVAQVSDQTGFLVQGDSALEADCDTNHSWEVKQELGRGFLPIDPADVPNYYAASPGEFLDGAAYDWDWVHSKAGWSPAITVGTGEPGRYPQASPVGTGSGINRWLLVEDKLPQMEYAEVPIGRVVRTEGLSAGRALPLTIPAHTHATILFDRGTMVTAFPELTLSRGQGASLRVSYAEALVDSSGHKGNRDEVTGRSLLGLVDTLVTDGGLGRTWSPLYWRTWRYLQVEVQTAGEALSLEQLKVHFSAFPFTEKAAFSASDATLGKLWDIGTRTARLNAHETYMDCPYWEQLQYVGDTRIQALISYVEFGDDRLARQAIGAIDDSRIAEGLTQGRYPSALTQVIPTFSLLWIGMIHDWWMYRPDTGAVADWVPHTRSVIDWYARHERPDGLLGTLPWWNFADWTHDFDFGVPPQDPDGGSALLTLVYVAALRDAADLEEAQGSPLVAAAYRAKALKSASAVERLCWDPARGLLADTPARTHFSEETNALGVLLDAMPKDQEVPVMRSVLAHRTPNGAPPPVGEFSPASIYFRFYLARAMDHAGLSDEYLENLGPWRAMLGLGLTTWAETAEPTRSDDHAWSAHPNYDLLTLVAGIRPAASGFSSVRVAPHLSGLTELSARMPHPRGDISVHYRLVGELWSVDITLPRGLAGTLEWGAEKAPLSEGPNHFEFKR